MVKLDEQCLQIKDCVLSMANAVSKMYALSLEALEFEDKEKALKVIKMDDVVNRYEEEINDLAIDALALLSPVASDLRKVLAAIKIASDLERIGDYAKGIAFFMIKNGGLDEEIMLLAKQLGDVFLTMLDHAMDSYAQSDAHWAMSIPEEDLEIDRLFDEILNVLKNRAKIQERFDIFIPIIGMLRNLKRAGEHTKNICEHTIFEIKGQHVEFN
ncbi:MAG: phosphate signaling complex protein PhoU [Anaerorhabdus sp.]